MIACQPSYVLAPCCASMGCDRGLLCHGGQVPISRDEFSRAVEWVDKDESGELDVEEFIGV